MTCGAHQTGLKTLCIKLVSSERDQALVQATQLDWPMLAAELARLCFNPQLLCKACQCLKKRCGKRQANSRWRQAVANLHLTHRFRQLLCPKKRGKTYRNSTAGTCHVRCRGSWDSPNLQGCKSSAQMPEAFLGIKLDH